ncbi:MAG TPA: hypothetical protein VGB51_00545 [Actinomycetota bacterium]
MIDLELRLRDLAAELDVPEAAGLPEVVRRRLEGVTPMRRRSRLRTVALVAAAILLLAGTAVAARFAIRGVEILPTPPEAPVAPPGEGLALGDPVTLEKARDAVPFEVGVLPALGDPDGVFLDDSVPDGRISMTYVPRPGLPRDRPTGLGALFVQFRGAVDEEKLVGKVFNQGSVERVSVDGGPAFWLEGPHVVYLLDANGEVREDTVRLAGNVLLWQSGDITLRLESGLSQAEAIAAAESLSGT